MSLEELSLTSHAIVLGETLERRSYWSEDGSKIYTDVTIRVADRMKGDPAAEAVITVPGGRVGNTLYEVSDMPIFVDGEEVLLFLWEHPSGKTLVTGGMQGKLQVIGEEEGPGKIVQGFGLRDEALHAISAGPDPEPSLNARPLRDVVTEIEKYVLE